MEIHLILVCGIQGSGKTYLSKKLCNKYNREKNIVTYLSHESPLYKNILDNLKFGECKNIIIVDGVYSTSISRLTLVNSIKDKSKNAKVFNSYIYYSDPKYFDDYIINVLRRQYRIYNEIFMDSHDIKSNIKANKDSQVFPIAAMFQSRKRFETPTKDEPFAKILTFHHIPVYDSSYSNSALILDYDGTLRKSSGEKVYPTKVEDILIKDNVCEILQNSKANHILGISNQSGIAKGEFGDTLEISKVCIDNIFKHTNNLLGKHIDFYYCHHRSGIPTCYCRKPQVGLAVLLIEKYKLDPTKCTFVGDMKTDETLANRIGFNFVYANKFFS